MIHNILLLFFFFSIFPYEFNRECLYKTYIVYIELIDYKKKNIPGI